MVACDRAKIFAGIFDLGESIYPKGMKIEKRSLLEITFLYVTPFSQRASRVRVGWSLD
jgi:hypothetical protein